MTGRQTMETPTFHSSLEALPDAKDAIRMKHEESKTLLTNWLPHPQTAQERNEWPTMSSLEEKDDKVHLTGEGWWKTHRQEYEHPVSQGIPSQLSWEELQLFESDPTSASSWSFQDDPRQQPGQRGTPFGHNV